MGIRSGLIAKNPSVVFTALGKEEGVLLHLESKFYFGLNETALVLWQRLEKGATLFEALVADICRCFTVERQEAEKDIEEVIGQFLREGLVQVGEG